jgi:nucleotide-binding universal stress UspA family protein
VIDTILLGLDDSPGAFRAAAVAVELAAALSARLVGVSVLDGALTREPPPAWSASPPDGAAEFRAVHAAQRHLREVAARHGLDVDLRTAHGHVADRLLELVRRERADLLVVGRADQPGLRIPRLGRTAEQVLEFSDVPVLVVPVLVVPVLVVPVVPPAR